MDKYKKFVTIIHKFLRGSGIKFTAHIPANDAEFVKLAQEFLKMYKELILMTDIKELPNDDYEFVVECANSD